MNGNVNENQEISKLEAEIIRLRRLVSLKHYTDEQIVVRAKENLRKKEIDVEFLTGYLDQAELKAARELTYKYLDDYTIQSISDKNTLKEVIRLEVNQMRLHEKMDALYKENERAVPLQMLDAVHKNIDAIIKLKTSLGLNRGKDKKEAYDVLQHLMKRGKAWREENQASRVRRCPHCQQFIHFIMRMEAWEAKKHPFFKDNRLFNKKLFDNLGKTVTIDETFISEVIETSPDYIQWMIDKSKKADSPSADSSAEASEEPDVLPKDENEGGVLQKDIQLLECETPKPDVQDSKG